MDYSRNSPKRERRKLLLRLFKSPSNVHLPTKPVERERRKLHFHPLEYSGVKRERRKLLLRPLKSPRNVHLPTKQVERERNLTFPLLLPLPSHRLAPLPAYRHIPSLLRLLQRKQRPRFHWLPPLQLCLLPLRQLHRLLSYYANKWSKSLNFQFQEVI